MPAALLVLLVVLAAVAGLLLWRARAGPGRLAAALGGAAPEKSPHLVVDLLNLTHHLRASGALPGGRSPLDTCDVLAAVEHSTPLLRPRFAGQLMYVAKDRESALNSPRVRALYQAAARRHGVHIHVVERYADEGEQPRRSHSALGRDDFYMGLLAWKHRCGVLTADRMRDFQALKSEVRPFQVYEYAYWREQPAKNQVKPAARDYDRVARPSRLDYADFGLG